MQDLACVIAHNIPLAAVFQCVSTLLVLGQYWREARWQPVGGPTEALQIAISQGAQRIRKSVTVTLNTYAHALPGHSKEAAYAVASGMIPAGF